MRTVKEMATLTGISVRTLHYYDAIDLLKPTKKTESGYRLYDDQALTKLQSILFFRELRFTLQEIKNILNRPDFNFEEALAQQITLLELEQERLAKLISYARDMQQKGGPSMVSKMFDDNALTAYKAEVKARWGDTEAYQEYTLHEENGAINDAVINDLMAYFVVFGNMRHLSPADPVVQKTVADFQHFISDHFYTCHNDMLNNLGSMYVSDERFKQRIDHAGGAGTANFVQQAIQSYCDHF